MAVNIIPAEEMDYKDEKVAVDDVSVTYVQSNDCTEEEGVQTLIISTRNNGVARFLNLKTGEEGGWSFDSIDDLVKLIKDFKKRCEYREK